MKEFLEGKKFLIEHALNMYASSFVVMPASGLYDDAVLKQYEKIIRTCHIYLIGQVPKVEFVDAQQDRTELITYFEVLGERHDLRWPLPEGAQLEGDMECGCYVVDRQGIRMFPSETNMMLRLGIEKGLQDFEVLYIGQAFGEDGSRNAVDRLKKHETLQKIAVKGIPDGYALTLLMLEVEPDNRMITTINPRADDWEHGSERIAKGLDKLFHTSEAERTTLYEASLIRYFQPRFNKEFKDSFPSTNMKVLADCYDKDMVAIVAEICINEIPFRLYTENVKPQHDHFALHYLHDDDARKVFFS